MDKEFEYYRFLPQNQAFALPLVGLFEIAGKRSTEDKDEPFKFIKDRVLAEDVKAMIIQEFETFWKHSSELNLRSDLIMDNIFQRTADPKS